MRSARWPAIRSAATTPPAAPPPPPAPPTVDAPVAVHTYPDVGDYTVSLIVTDNLGATDNATVAVHVTPANVPPVAVATADPMSGRVPLAVDFEGSASHDSEG